ncbi:MAG: zinc-dependent metalloprotease [Elusimicrobiota bacterium]
MKKLNGSWMCCAVILLLGAVPARAQKISAVGQIGSMSGKDVSSVAKGITRLKEAHSGQKLFKISKGGRPHRMEIRADQLDTPYLCSVTIIKATGERGLYASEMAGSFIWNFRMIGDREKIQFVEKNMLYRAEEGSPEAKSIERSFSDSILATAEVVKPGKPAAGEEAPQEDAQQDPQEGTEVHVIEAEKIFLEDLANVESRLEGAYPGADFVLDPRASYMEEIKTFSKNVEIQSHLVFSLMRGREALDASQVLPDPRKISIVVRYSLSALPEAPSFESRPADERVGHFTVAYQDLSRPDLRDQAEPYVHPIARWNLEKLHPDQALSEVKDPIEVWVDETTPERFRGSWKKAVKAWNAAFEAIGFKDAMVVKEVDKDLSPERRASFDPADASYDIVVTWFAGKDAGGAQGPMRINPLTGEIYNAMVRMSDGIARYAQQEMPLISPDPAPSASGPEASESDYFRQAAEQAAFSQAALRAGGSLSPEQEERFVDDFVTSIMVHELGHNLGLRHNFKGSLNPGEEGLLSASIMDYIPSRIPAPGSAQEGPYHQTEVGPYDYHAIEYAYKPLAAKTKQGQSAELEDIASKSASDPALVYGTDEDAWSGQDPEASMWDLGSDPVAFADTRVAQARGLWKRLEENTPEPGKGYASLRRDFQAGLRAYGMGVRTTFTSIGGIVVSRDRAGSPGGRVPFEPVPVERQREALDFLAKNVFDSEALRFSPDLLKKLGRERLGTFDNRYPDSSPVPVRRWAESLQESAMYSLLNARTLWKLEASRSLVDDPGRILGAEELLDTVQAAVWKDLDQKGASVSVSPLQRSLQRRHVESLIGLRKDPRAPSDAAALARDGLKTIAWKIDNAVSRASGRVTRAHLEEIRSLIREAVEPAGKSSDPLS